MRVLHQQFKIQKEFTSPEPKESTAVLIAKENPDKDVEYYLKESLDFVKKQNNYN
jgi:hypothetical protein